MIKLIRGVSFEVPQAGKKLLRSILECVNVESYCWHSISSQNEVWDFHDSTNAGDFFTLGFYDGKSFSQRISLDHWIIFLKLQAYFEDGKFYHIHTYEEFQNSDCQLLLLIADCNYVDIYAKDQVVAKALYENALSNKFSKVEFITESNDGRTGMDLR
jgi:hypothetical protein